jgi:hypothetical protein
MFNRAPSLGRLTLALLCLVGLVGLFLVVRCRPDTNAATRSATNPKQSVRLNVLNVSHCEWRVVITPMAGGDTRTLKLRLDQAIDVELPPGDYEVEQTMLGADTVAEAARRFPMKLVAGENYRWRLVTLLSGSTETKGQP